MINEKTSIVTGRGSVSGTVEDGFVNKNRIYKVGRDSGTGELVALKKYDMVELDASDPTAVVPYAGGTFAGIVGTLGETPVLADLTLDRTVVLYTTGEFYKDTINNLPGTLPVEVTDKGITISIDLQ